MKRALTLVSLLVSIQAFGSVALECGAGLLQADRRFKQRDFLLVSHDGVLEGRSGVNWNLYDADGTEVSGVLTNERGDLRLKLVTGHGAGGPVGFSYVIAAPVGATVTTAKKFNLGGFADGSFVGDVDCLVQTHAE